MPIRLTRELAFAASLDAANRSMRTGQRTTWDEDDYNICASEFNRLWPPCTHGIEPESYCWLCDSAHSTRAANR